MAARTTQDENVGALQGWCKKAVWGLFGKEGKKSFLFVSCVSLAQLLPCVPLVVRVRRVRACVRLSVGDWLCGRSLLLQQSCATGLVEREEKKVFASRSNV
jgi:hypothetical protein